MPYSVFTDRAIPYHLDGSVVKIINSSDGIKKSFSLAELQEMNDTDFVEGTATFQEGFNYCVVFFPELRDISGIFSVVHEGLSGGYLDGPYAIAALQGSVDSTNGLDGTWTDATMPNGYPSNSTNLDAWRKNIKPITDLTGVKAIRFQSEHSDRFKGIYVLHLYGHKTAGQTPRDILFLDAENADAEFAIPLDFGDRPAGTSAIRQIKVKNVDPALTANTLAVEVVDTVDNIRVSDSAAGPWVTSKTFTSLAPNTASSVIYVKCETATPPTPLGPMRAPIKATVGAWS